MITKSPMNRMVVSMVGSCSWPLRIGAVDGDHILVDLTHLARAGLLTLSLVLLTIRAGARCGRAGILLGCHLVVHEEVRRRTDFLMYYQMAAQQNTCTAAPSTCPDCKQHKGKCEQASTCQMSKIHEYMVTVDCSNSQWP